MKWPGGLPWRWPLVGPAGDPSGRGTNLGRGWVGRCYSWPAAVASDFYSRNVPIHHDISVLISDLDGAIVGYWGREESLGVCLFRTCGVPCGGRGAHYRKGTRGEGRGISDVIRSMGACQRKLHGDRRRIPGPFLTDPCSLAPLILFVLVPHTEISYPVTFFTGGLAIASLRLKAHDPGTDAVF